MVYYPYQLTAEYEVNELNKRLDVSFILNYISKKDKHLSLSVNKLVLKKLLKHFISIVK